MATRRRRSPGTQRLGRQLHLDSGRSIAAVARSIGIHEMTLGKKGEETKGIGQIHGQDLSRPNLPSWNGLATTTPPDGWSVISQKVTTREGTAVKYERSRTGPQRSSTQSGSCATSSGRSDLDSSVLAVTRPPGLRSSKRTAAARRAARHATATASPDPVTAMAGDSLRVDQHHTGRAEAEKLWFIRARSPTMIGACARISG